MSSSAEPKTFEIVVFYKIGILGDSEDAVSSFAFEVSESTKLGELEDMISDKLTMAAMQVSSEFSQNLLDHLHQLMTRDNDEDQTEFGTGSGTSGD